MTSLEEIESCEYRQKIKVKLIFAEGKESLKPCCTHPDGPKVPDSKDYPPYLRNDPWFCDGAIETGQCPMGYTL